MPAPGRVPSLQPTTVPPDASPRTPSCCPWSLLVVERTRARPPGEARSLSLGPSCRNLLPVRSTKRDEGGRDLGHEYAIRWYRGGSPHRNDPQVGSGVT